MFVHQLVEKFLLFNRQNRAARTADFYACQLGKLAALHGSKDALALRPHHVFELRATWHFILAVQRLYHWAVDEQELLPSNPVQKLRRPRLGRRRRVLTPCELLRLLRGAAADFRAYLLAARESAARPQEVRALYWENLCWQGAAALLPAELAAGRAYFILSDYKARERRADPTAPRIIPVSPRLGRLLLRLFARRRPEGLVFMTRGGKAWNKDSLRQRMKKALTAAGLGGGGRGERIVCYTMRHTALTSFAARGLQTSIVQLIAGHADVKTTSRYLHLQKEHLLGAWRAFHEKDRRGQGRGGQQLP